MFTTGRPQFILNGDVIRPNWLILGEGKTPRAWDLRPDVTEYPAETMGRLPVLGSLFRQPVATRLQGATRLSAVFLSGGNLMVPSNTNTTKAAVVHQRTEWAYNRRPKGITLTTPMVGSLFNGRGVGNAYATRDGAELIILISPTVVSEP